MPQLLVRDVSPETVAALKRRAAEHGRSAEAEHRALLDAALQKEREDDWWERARQTRESFGNRVFSDSADLIREDRDSR